MKEYLIETTIGISCLILIGCILYFVNKNVETIEDCTRTNLYVLVEGAITQVYDCSDSTLNLQENNYAR